MLPLTCEAGLVLVCRVWKMCLYVKGKQVPRAIKLIVIDKLVESRDLGDFVGKGTGASEPELALASRLLSVSLLIVGVLCWV